MASFAPLACITDHHDLKLVGVAAVICVIATYTALNLLSRACSTVAVARLCWLGAAAVALGGGVWSTHFVAMLAYHTPVPVGYDFDRTTLSILCAILGSALGLAIAVHYPRLRALGGAVVGLSVGVMHYLGMSAVMLPGQVVYDPARVIDSLAIGIGFCAAALLIDLAQRRFWLRLAAALLLSLGICGLHFTGMNASSMVFDTGLDAAPQTHSSMLAVAIAAASALILGLGLAGALFDEHLARRVVSEAARLRESEARFRQLANATFEGVFIHLEGRILDVNRTLCRLLGYSQEELIGRSMFDYISKETLPGALLRLSEPSGLPLEIEIINAEGTPVPVEVLAQDLVYNGDAARVVALRDLRERRKAEREIQHLAQHDALTGLVNRIVFHDRLTQAMVQAQRESEPRIAVLCIDLDRFKLLNDLHGYRAGDVMLKEQAVRLRDAVRAHDTVARLGDDEFAIIQTGAQPDILAQVAERLLTAARLPLALDGHQLLTSASIGIAVFPGDGRDSETLLRAAYAALHRAKEGGRNGYRFFEPATDLRLHQRSKLESDLRRAIGGGELQLHYQPLHACSNNALIGFEALLRWQHPERGAISPADFIPIAEESGLIVPLSRWVLATACRDARHWPPHLGVAVNLSPVQFRQPTLTDDILETLAQSGLPAQRLELEITEGVLMENTEQTLDTLRALKQAGIRISLDDFGTGFSSLSYLQRFPFDKLKIDRSFVSGMETNAGSMAIVRAIVALGHSLRITVTAEGVETPEQLHMLRHENCDHVQGFLLGRPQTLKQIQPLLQPMLTCVESHAMRPQ